MVTHSKYFGEIDVDYIEDAYDCYQTYEGRKVFTMLFFEEPFFSNRKITTEDVITADKLIDNCQKYIEISKQTIETSFQEKTLVYNYLEHHAETFNIIDLKKLNIDFKQNKEDLINALKDKLYFTSIAIDPSAQEEVLSLDFTISKDLTQYVIVIRMNRNGEVSDIDMES